MIAGRYGLTLPPRLSSLDLCDVVGEELRVGSDRLSGLFWQVGLVHTELSTRDRREIARRDIIQDGSVGVESADGLERFDRGVSVRLWVGLQKISTLHPRGYGFVRAHRPDVGEVPV